MGFIKTDTPSSAFKKPNLKKQLVPTSHFPFLSSQLSGNPFSLQPPPPKNRCGTWAAGPFLAVPPARFGGARGVGLTPPSLPEPFPGGSGR